MKIGICEWNIPTKGTAARFKWAAEAGLGAIEVDLESAAGEESLLNELRAQWRLAIPTLGLNYCCGHGMVDPAEAGGVRAAFHAAVNSAVELGIPKLQVPSFAASFINTPEDFDRTVEHYTYLCALAEDAGLVVGTENALSAERQLELLDRVGSPALKVYFDTRNAFAMGGLDSTRILRQLYPHVCEVHLKDGVGDGPSRPLGEGDSGFLDTLALLTSRGYAGWMLLENDYRSIAACRADMAVVAKNNRPHEGGPR